MNDVLTLGKIATLFRGRVTCCDRPCEESARREKFEGPSQVGASAAYKSGLDFAYCAPKGTE